MTDPGDNLPDFSGQVVVIYLKGAGHQAASLESPTFVRRAGRLFLEGIMSGAGERDWTAGLPAAVAWDEVQLYVTTTPEDLDDRYREFSTDEE